ncbi:MAG: chemotaxis protein CheW [Panacagrimonas sp.]
MSRSLRELRTDPFALLLELDARLRALRVDAAAASLDVWQGLAFRCGEHWVLAPRDDVREVIPTPRRTRVPNAATWLAGVANVRGNLLTVVDLGLLFGTAASAERASSRALVLNSDRVSLAFLADEVAGHRQFAAAEQCAAQDGAMTPHVLGGFHREGRDWQVLSLHRLAQSDLLRRAGA